MKKHLSLLALLLLPAAGLAAAPAPKAEPVVIDVRTPSEFAASHLTGAQNIDFQASDFEAQVKKLDKAKTYKLYCRSGRRSGLAEKQMKEWGFANVESVGSLQDAAKKLGKGCDGKAGC